MTAVLVKITKNTVADRRDVFKGTKELISKDDAALLVGLGFAEYCTDAPGTETPAADAQTLTTADVPAAEATVTVEGQPGARNVKRKK